jgi:3-oxoacyl-[acyl-carrier-protein] synthase-1
MALHDIPVRLAVVQMGMVCSLGADLETSCASARADLSRASEIPYKVVGPDGVWSDVTGHQAEYLTRGFRHDARLTRLLTAALEDLSAGVPRDVWPPAIDVYLAIPATFRDDRRQEIDRLSSPWESSELQPLDYARGQRIAEKAMAAARIPSRIGRLGVITQGQASAGVAIEAAALSFHKGNRTLALILAVDAPVDLDRVASIDARGRLKGPNVPAGAAPGEVGAGMLVASPEFVSSRELSTVGEILQPQSLESIPSFNTDAPPDGLALARLTAAVLRRLPFEQDTWCIVDMNGEVYRAREWGTAVIRIHESFPWLDTTNVWIPAMHFGDCGAATGLAATALAVRGFARRYAPAKSALVLSAADGPMRAAFAVVEQR